ARCAGGLFRRIVSAAGPCRRPRADLRRRREGSRDESAGIDMIATTASEETSEKARDDEFDSLWTGVNRNTFLVDLTHDAETDELAELPGDTAPLAHSRSFDALAPDAFADETFERVIDEVLGDMLDAIGEASTTTIA